LLPFQHAGKTGPVLWRQGKQRGGDGFHVQGFDDVLV
jgi:hypothetical protein